MIQWPECSAPRPIRRRTFRLLLLWQSEDHCQPIVQNRSTLEVPTTFASPYFTAPRSLLIERELTGCRIANELPPAYQRHFEDDLPLRTLPLTANELKDGPGTAAAAGAVPPGLFWGV